MKKLKKIFLVLCILCAFGLYPKAPVKAVDDSDFSGNEGYYSSLCSTLGLTDEEKEVCQLYSDYLSRKVDSIKDSIDSTKSQINTLKNNISAIQGEVEKLQGQVDELNTQIALIQEQIVAINGNIEALQIEIEDRNRRIDELNNQIMAHMVAIQPYVSLDQYIEFIMGATDFADLLRRTSVINEIMEYDTNQLRLLEEEKQKLKENMEDLEAQRNALAEKEALIASTKAAVEEALEQQRQLIAAFKEQQAALEESLREQQSIAEDALNEIEDIAKSIGYITPSSGWIYPVNGYFYISGGCPVYYPGGPSHNGVDFAASYGTPVVAVANGLVAFTSDGYPGYGYLGNYVGVPSGGANTVCLIVEVNGITYGVWYYHMAPGHYVSAGDVVSQGQALGRVGSSGNSTGPHTHVDVFYLGTIGTQGALNLLKQSTAFGAGWGSSSFCSVRGTPCRLNPQDIFGVYFGYGR